jgi:redox-sensitive bicupin YhaK (pirin superfamily)
MEIVSITLSGALAHKDSTGTEKAIVPGEVQVMSAGTGILHSEYNHSKDDETNFLQLWIFPDKKGHKPRYDQKSFDLQERKNKIQFIVTPEKKDGNLWLNQDAYLALADVEKGKSIEYKIHTKGNGAYLFLIDGKISIGKETLSKRDGIGIWETDGFSLTAEENSRVLLIEIPMN